LVEVAGAGATNRAPKMHDRATHQRRSIRLKRYDYAAAGAYFVTICAQDHAGLFGEVIDNEMRLNDAGQIAQQGWSATVDHFTYVQLDAFVVMPNHVHCVIIKTVGAGSPRPDKGRTSTERGNTGDEGAGTAPLRVKRWSLGQIVAYYKYLSTKSINAARRTPGAPVWQRNYYEHVIRNEASLNTVRRYILENPLRWAYDRENPQCIGRGDSDLPAEVYDHTPPLLGDTPPPTADRAGGRVCGRAR
jgi:REP element-mobilizing transposase RayT